MTAPTKTKRVKAAKEPAYIPTYDEPLAFQELSPSGKARALEELERAKNAYIKVLFYCYKTKNMIEQNQRYNVADALRRYGSQAAFCQQKGLAERAFGAAWELKKNSLTLAELVEDAL